MLVRHTLVALIAGVLLTGAPVLLAAPGNRDPGNVPGNGPAMHHPMQKEHQEMRDQFRDLLKSLNLTPDQRAKVRETLRTFHQSVVKYRQDNKDAIEQARAEIKAGREAKDRQKIKEGWTQLKAIWQKGPQREDLMNQIRALLTPEQQKQFDAGLKKMHQEMKADMAEHHHKHKADH